MSFESSMTRIVKQLENRQINGLYDSRVPVDQSLDGAWRDCPHLYFRRLLSCTSYCLFRTLVPSSKSTAMFVWLIDMERLTFKIRKVVVYWCESDGGKAIVGVRKRRCMIIDMFAYDNHSMIRVSRSWFHDPRSRMIIINVAMFQASSVSCSVHVMLATWQICL